MMIFVQDCGWRGSILVIANNEAEARDMMKDSYNYDANLEVEAYQIEHGFKWEDLGDC